MHGMLVGRGNWVLIVIDARLDRYGKLESSLALEAHAERLSTSSPDYFIKLSAVIMYTAMADTAELQSKLHRLRSIPSEPPRPMCGVLVFS